MHKIGIAGVLRSEHIYMLYIAGDVRSEHICSIPEWAVGIS